jgi:xanthine/uracil/vitamin C permease (AzgA family)
MHIILERVFQLKKKPTTVKTELIAGFTTFSTMIYYGSAMVATILASFSATLCWNGVPCYPILKALTMKLKEVGWFIWLIACIFVITFMYLDFV